MGDGVAIRTVRYLYFLPYAGPNRDLAEKPTKFFDLAEDPYQFQNRAGDGANTEAARDMEIARDLDARLRQWHAAIPRMAE